MGQAGIIGNMLPVSHPPELTVYFDGNSPLSWLAEAAYRLFLPLRPRLQTWLRRHDARQIRP